MSFDDNIERIYGLLEEAADLWMETVGDEQFISGISSSSTSKFLWAAEHEFFRAHKEYFPQNHVGIDWYAPPREIRQSIKSIDLPDVIPEDGVGCVYYHFGDDEELLYVGKSRHFLKRQQGHKKECKWWNEIREIKAWITPDHIDLEWLEIQEIKRNRPKYNIRDNRS